MQTLQTKLNKLNFFSYAMKNALENTLDLYSQKEGVEAQMRSGFLAREPGIFELLEIVGEIEKAETNLLSVFQKKQELTEDVEISSRGLSEEDKRAIEWYNYKDEEDCSMSEILLRELDKNPNFLG